MSNITTVFICAQCDAQFPKWSGRCLECGAWGSLSRQAVDKKVAEKSKIEFEPAEIVDFKKLEARRGERIKIGVTEIDRVLGGGIVPGSLVLLSGEPGIGKSTLVAQITAAIQSPTPPVYLSGEESAHQIKLRFDRLGLDVEKISFICETNADKILATIEKFKPDLVIIDSIQTIYSSELPSEAGSINQIRAAAGKFLEIAKKNNIAIILVGHVTKDGLVAGPKSLEHMVDTVIYLESETTHNYRILKAIKNRFGSTNEIGIFDMTSKGFKEVTNPSAVFIDINKNTDITGSVVSCIVEGTRSFLVEIQALVTKTVFGYPQRKASGFDLNRLQILSAVLTKRSKVNLTNQDVILNIVGGLRINDPALDLAVCMAITSSLLNQTIDRKTLVLGEVGLGSEVRKVGKLKERLETAEKLGFTSAIIPESNIKQGKIKLIKINGLEDLINYLKER